MPGTHDTTFPVTGTVTANPGTGTFTVAFQRPTTSDLTEAIINIAASGDNTVIAAVAAQTIRIFKMFFVTASPVNVTVEDGAGVNLTGVMNNVRAGIWGFDGEPWFTSASGGGFVINLSAAVQVSGRVYYRQS